MQYIDRTEKFKSVKAFQATGSGRWEAHTWKINDALFNSECGSHDFRITFGVDADIVIEECSILAKPKFSTILPDVFSSDMVLQREAMIPVWGLAEDGTKITVTFAGKTKTTRAKAGKWEVVFHPMKANTQPQQMTIMGSDGYKKVLSNILIGDIYLAAGQSNMEMKLREVVEGEEAIRDSHNPMLRLFTVKKSLLNSVPPVGTVWKISAPDSSAKISAVAYFFANEIQKKTGIPIGIIQCAFTATVTETWTGPSVLKAGFPKWENYLSAARKNPNYPRQNTPSRLYNRMLTTVMPFSLKGFLWYQGEGNNSRPEEQKKLFPLMMEDWRQQFRNENLPVFFVQLPRYENKNWHAFRCAQLEISKTLPNSFLAITIDLPRDWDLGDGKSVRHPVHPATKKAIGHRLALLARANLYHEEDLVYSGPVVEQMTVNSGRAVLTFSHVGGGLIALDSKPLRGFYISFDGENFEKAEAKILGDTVTVLAESVTAPVAVRYASGGDMGLTDLDVNLGNTAGLPASPFTIKSVSEK